MEVMSQENKQISQKGLKVSVKVTFSKEDVSKEYTKHLAKVASKMNVKGFRPSAVRLR